MIMKTLLFKNIRELISYKLSKGGRGLIPR